MAEFKPYSVTRGGFATPRELFLSVVKDLTQFYRDGDNAFEVKYPLDETDLDFENPNAAVNDVIVVQATGHVDPCVDDQVAQQPWVIRFDTRASIGHGMGHVNVTTPLQIDWAKPKVPAIPYIPPNTVYDPDEVQSMGTLGFVGLRAADHLVGANGGSNERGFINRAVYHTNVTQVQQSDEYGNLKWELRPLTGGTPVIMNGTRRQIPVAGLDETGRGTYEITLEWYELMNPGDIDLSAVFPESGSPPRSQPTDATLYAIDGIADPDYQKRSCKFFVKAYPGQTAADLMGTELTTFRVEGELPPSIADLAKAGVERNEDNVPQALTFRYGEEYPELKGYKFVVTGTGSSYTKTYTGAWEDDTATSGTWGVQEKAITDFATVDAVNNVGIEVYDNTRYELVPVSESTFDHNGDAKDPREGALNVPMSYALTVSDHGIVLATWDQAVDQYETNEGHRFGWFTVQRLVDKDTGLPLIDQTKSFCPLYCVYGVYHEKIAGSMYFVVRESDVHRPSEEQLAGEDGPDSNAVLNTFEQIAVSEDYEYVITVPSGLTTQRYLYLEEADLIGYTSADVISNGALSEFQMYDEGVCSITGITDENECLAQGGEWEASTRLYKGLPATGKYNTGMRVLMRWYGGRLGSEPVNTGY